MIITGELVVLVAVFVGGALQRTAGMGFGMVVAPVALIYLGGTDGLIFANLLAAAAAAILLVPLRRDISLRRLKVVVLGCIPGAVAGSFLVGKFDEGIFRLVAGSLLLVAVVITATTSRLTLTIKGPLPLFAASGTAGILVSLTGVGAPPLALYGVASRWEPRSFVATMQPFQVLVATAAIVSTILSHGNTWPTFHPATWIFAAIALLTGLVAGRLLNKRLSKAAARVIILVIAAAGSAALAFSGIQLALA